MTEPGDLHDPTNETERKTAQKHQGETGAGNREGRKEKGEKNREITGRNGFL
jgi:hypothetical protein